MGRKKGSDDLSRQDWIAHHYSKTWRSSLDKSTPYINLSGYNIFYKQNLDGSWSYCLRRQGTSQGSDEEWSTERFRSGEEARLALLERFADVLGKV